MKSTFVLFCCTIVLVTCEPPRYSTFNQQQQAPPAIPPAPYNPSGWQPSGPRFNMLPRQQTPPTSYGAPKEMYGPPTTELLTTTQLVQQPDVETLQVTPLSKQEQRRKEPEESENIERGQYYLLLPEGRLQRVVYMTTADYKKMSYSAKLKYHDVEPISGPVYSAINQNPLIPIYHQ